MRRIGVFLVPVLVPILMAGAVLAKSSAPSGTAEQKDLPAFLNSLGKKVSSFTTLKTDFTQEKEMALFKNKIVISGRIYLKKPNTIAWHVDRPLRYSVLITDKSIRQWDEDTDRIQEISLEKNPIFQNVLSQMTVWFSGEYGSLLKNNTVRLEGSDPLVLECVPRAGTMAGKVVKNITITFRKDRTYLRKIRIQELSGDVTTIIFSNTIINAPLDKSDFEVKPARERRDPSSMNGAGPKTARSDAIDRLRGTSMFSNGEPGHV